MAVRLAGKTNKQLRAALELAYELGFEVTFTAKGHVRFVRDGVHTVICAGTGGRGRGDRNTMAQLRRCASGVCGCIDRRATA